MGCCYSLSAMEDRQEMTQQNHGGGDPPLTKFSFSDLNMATNNFGPENIVSETGDEASDIVYRGVLESHLGLIAIKKFKNMAWPDPKQFAEEAERVGKLRHRRVVNLIGYCCDGDERLLVADFMPNDTLAKRLFHRRNQTMEWSVRLKVAYAIAEALDYCSTTGFASYNSLSAYTVLFQENGEACLSCFGLMKEIKDDQITTGSVNPESVIYRFGTVLVNLLSGMQIPPSHAPEMINGTNVNDLMDPKLEGNFSTAEATVVFKLASQCLQHDDRESLNTNDLVAVLEPLQTRTQVPSYQMLEMRNHEELSLTQISPLGEACLIMDLTAIHNILVKAGYEDDKEVTEFSFEEWFQEVKELQIVRKRGDDAFIEQDFKTAIDCYSQFIEGRKTVYPSVYARRSLCYLFCNQPDRALRDGMHAQSVFSDWPTAFYLQSVALSKLNMMTDSADILKEAALLEAKRKEQHEEEES